MYSADEVFLCGTEIEIAPVSVVDHRRIGGSQQSGVTKALQQLYFDVVRGKLPRYAGWSHPVYTYEFSGMN